MVDGTYVIEVDTPLGRKTGTVELASSGNTVSATIDAPIIGKQRLSGPLEGDSFTASGSLSIFLVGKVDFTANGQVEGDNLRCDLHTSKGNFSISGTRK